MILYLKEGKKNLIEKQVNYHHVLKT
jgi:hypothetical protein